MVESSMPVDIMYNHKLERKSHKRAHPEPHYHIVKNQTNRAETHKKNTLQLLAGTLAGLGGLLGEEV